MKLFNNKIWMMLFAGLIVLASCEDLEDVREDPKRPGSANPDYLFSYAEIELADYLATSSVNTNVGRLLAQYWSQTTYTTESRYGLEDRELADALWENHYRDVLNNLNSAKGLLPEFETNEAVLNNKLAMVTILEVYSYQMLIDTFGDVPFTEALAGAEGRSPAYDDAQTVYGSLIEMLNSAIAQMDPAADGFAGADLIYDGDVASWLKFANALKIKLAMRVADVPSFNSQTLVEEAYANAILTNADNATLEYVGGSYPNPVYEDIVISGRSDYVLSNTIVDQMNMLEDPRRSYYMTTNDDGEYVGLTYGLESGIGGDLGPYAQLPALVLDETYQSVLLDAAEVNFFLAEAAERGWNVGGNTETYYNNAITASIAYWGTASEADPATITAETAAYLAMPEVALATAEGGNVMNAIALQKWIALYNQGMEGWIEWKRLDYPQLNAPVKLSQEDIPVRLRYPVQERSVNNANREAAASRIGGDDIATQVFWDVQ
uniref:SusD/RagB family nutrient-binding outer membrane lipoprotein n=1 Tax=Roseihalotalea indica TaxID=2867963 RepID=A0AA49JH24_9BACT|nr:SusD/RagB family nutrient-binding outer membrane lipoprotein [Tunicatimonas sp. TK19036]